MSTLTPTTGTLPGHGHDDGHGHHAHHEQGFISKYVFSTDHKVIGIQFLITTLLMLMVGGALALGVRWQLAFPWRELPIFGRLIFFFFNDTATTEIYTRSIVGSVRCV